MTFLYPQVLLGLLALSIPIIIHLFNFRRAKRVYFSTNQFLKSIKQAQSSKLTLKHLLVLLSRLLFIFFLVLAFAQPLIPGQRDLRDNDEVYIYWDNSMSMSNEIKPNLKAFDLGYSYVNDIIELYPSETRFRLLTNDFAPFSSLSKSKEEIKELITEIDYSNISRSLEDISSRFQYNENTALPSKKEFYIISDFQKSTMGALSDFAVDSAADYNFIPINYDRISNVFVDSVYLSNPFLTRFQDNQLNVSLRNNGDLPVNDLIVKLFVNDQQVANGSVDIEPNSESPLTFNLAGGLKIHNKGRISFEEFPVAFDNDFYFSLNITERISIMEIKATKDKTAVEKVYGNSELFAFSSFDVGNIDYNLIMRSDLLILNELEFIEPSLSTQIINFIQQEGTILIIPAPEADINALQSILANLRLQRSNIFEKMQPLSSPDLSDPFFQGIFENEEDNFQMPKSSRVVDWSAPGEVLLKFKNDLPFLSRVQPQAYLMAAPLRDELSGFHRHAIFVPVMYRIASLSKSISRQLEYSLSETVITVLIDSVSGTDIVKLRNQKQELIPNQRVIKNALILELPKFSLQPGYYELVKDDQVIKLLSFNFGKSESLLKQYGREEIEKTFSEFENVKIFEVSEVSAVNTEIQKSSVGIPLWKYSLMLALIFLFAEILIIRYFK